MRRRTLAAHQTPEPRGGGGWGGAQDTNASAAALAPFRVQRSVAAVSNSPTQASTAEERNVRGGVGLSQGYCLVPSPPSTPHVLPKAYIPPPPSPPLLYAAPTGAQSRLCEVAWKVFVDSAHLSGTTAADATAERVQPLLSPPSPTSSPSPPLDGGEKTTPTTKKGPGLIDISRLWTPAAVGVRRSSMSQRLAGWAPDELRVCCLCTSPVCESDLPTTP